MKKFILVLAAILVFATSAAAASDGIKVLINGVTLDATAQIIDGSVYVPLRAVAEALDKNVSWNGDSQTVEITDGNHYIAVEGTPHFQKTVDAAMGLLKQHSPTYHEFVSRYIHQIKQGTLPDGNANPKSGLGTNVFGVVYFQEPNYNIYYLAEMLAHEAKHVQMYDEFLGYNTYNTSDKTDEELDEVQEYRALVEGYRARIAIKDPEFLAMSNDQLLEKLNKTMDTKWWIE